jgi:hypothetical protein
LRLCGTASQQDYTDRHQHTIDSSFHVYRYYA